MVKACDDESVLDFLPLFLSNIPFLDKIRLLEKLPWEAYEDVEKTRELEKELEQGGRRKFAQYVRWCSFEAEFQNSEDEPERDMDQYGKAIRRGEEIIKTEIKFNWIVQRLSYLKEEIAKLRMVLFATEQHLQNVSDLERSVQSLKEDYWACKRRTWINECDLKPIMKRSFVALRKDPRWYLSDWLRKDCARKGGCCGRDCGCCEKPRDTEHLSHHGHCTTACGCCVRHKELSESAILGNEYAFEYSDVLSFGMYHEISGYKLNMVRAYIFGVDFLNDLDAEIV